MDGDPIEQLVARYGVADLLTRGVLLVDDELPNLTVLQGLLEPDYLVYTADSGAHALKIVESTPLDIVLTDQRMPEMNGVELLERVRHMKPDLAGIVLTAYTDTPALISAINTARAFRFLKKPWSAEDVLSAIFQATSHVYHTRAIRRLVDLLARRTDELGAALGNLQAAQEQMVHLERLGSMGRFSAGVIHDLRNAMMGLLAIEEELPRRGVAPDLENSVSIGLAGLRSLLGMLETLHEYVRSSRLSVAVLPMAPADIIKNAITVVRLDMNYRDRNVTVRVGQNVPQINGDRPKLVQVLLNLIRNAVQATGSGQSILIETAAGGDGSALLAVEDEGTGIPVEINRRLFEPFVSGKGAEGMGMGLYMARLIVEAHQGQIRATSRPTGGTRVEVALPGVAGIAR